MVIQLEAGSFLRRKLRNRILEVAARLFHEQGFYATSVATILRKAGVNGGSLYLLPHQGGTSGGGVGAVPSLAASRRARPGRAGHGRPHRAGLRPADLVSRGARDLGLHAGLPGREFSELGEQAASGQVRAYLVRTRMLDDARYEMATYEDEGDGEPIMAPVLFRR